MGNFNRDGRSGQSRGGSQSRGRSSYGGSRGGPREMFKAICDNCGKECQVPFKPTSGKPVYCSDCFEKMGGGSSDSPRRERSERPSFDQNNTKFEELNAKLDKILNLLESK